jgi:DNA polymerase (family 10)
MRMTNADVARILYEVADLLELKGVQFKPNAYRKAAKNIVSLTKDLREYQKTGKLEDIPGVGEAIAKKVEEILATGNLKYLDDLKEELPAGLLQIMQVAELGPKTAMRLYQELKVTNIEELKQAAEHHRIRGLKGFGEKTEAEILEGLRQLEGRSRKMILAYAYPVAMSVKEYVAQNAQVELISLAGSLRRMKETIGDIDLLVGSDDPGSVMEVFAKNPEVSEIIVRGPTKTSVRLRSGVQVDLRVVAEEQYGAALQYFTGSKEHNVELRQLAIAKGFKLNEYGLFRKDTSEAVASRTEEDIYKALGMVSMPPEIRENRGEIETSLKGRLPRLLDLKEVKGDLHVHSLASDGSATIEEIAHACKRRGYEYVGISDHSQSLKVANGLSKERLMSNIDIAHNITDIVGGIKVLVGSEVEILEDGSLDYPNEVLRELDYVIGAVHSKFKMEEKEMTERIVTALSNEHLTILAHPTGRLLMQREPYAVELDTVMEAARSSGVCLELNAFAERLDLNDVHCLKAKEHGVMISIGSDAHSLAQLDYMFYGVATARRAWLGPDDVLNTRSLDGLFDILTS